MTDDERGRISREEAKEIIEEAKFGSILIADTEFVPTLGEVDREDREMEIAYERYMFGDADEVVGDE